MLNNGNDEFNDQLNSIEVARLDRDLLQQRKVLLSEQLDTINGENEQKVSQL